MRHFRFSLIAITIVVSAVLLVPSAIHAQDAAPTTDPLLSIAPDLSAQQQIPPEYQVIVDQGAWLFTEPLWVMSFPEAVNPSVDWLSGGFVAGASVYNYGWQDGVPQTAADLIAYFNEDWFNGVFSLSSDWVYITQSCAYPTGVYWEFLDTRDAGNFFTRYWVEPVDTTHVFAYAFTYTPENGPLVANAYSRFWRPDSIGCWAPAEP
ncbi:MAG: hypothetical protein U0670_06785 [Anaerolineae bacterium]